MKIEIIAGSSRKQSLSIRVAKNLLTTLQTRTEHNVGLIAVNQIAMPFVEKAYSRPEDAPKEIRPYAQRVFEADAFILCTPEYNGSYTPAMKNFLDHFPKQVHKPFGLVTASPGAMGGMRAAQQLLQMVPAFFGIASPFMLIVPGVDEKFAEDGELKALSFQQNIDTFVHEFLWLAENLTVAKGVEIS
ncbi:MAG: NAD(P)H-dependent oxidoreductase [Leeuwenhoekiella sp.]